MTLKSGEILPHNASLESLFAQLEAYPVFFAPNRKTILNGRYIKSVQLTHITMCDGHTFSAIGAGIGYAKNAWLNMRNDCTMNVDVKISVSDCTPVCILYRNDNAAVICIHTADACHILHHNVIAPGF